MILQNSQLFCKVYAMIIPSYRTYLTDICKDVDLIWSPIHDTAFAEMKQLVTGTPKLTTIQYDASSERLGDTLLQWSKPLAYENRTLSNTEQRYADWKDPSSCVLTGKISPVPIWQKNRDSHRSQLQGILVHTQKYSINVEYVKGIYMYITDMLSWSYLTDKENYQTEFEHVIMVSFLPICDERLSQKYRATDQNDMCNQPQTLYTHTSRMRYHPRTASYLKAIEFSSCPDSEHTHCS